MQKKLQNFHQKYIDLVTNTLFASIDREVKKDLNEFNKLEQGLTESLPSKWKSYEELIQFKQKALDLTESIWGSFSPEDFNGYAQAFISRMDLELSKFPEVTEVQQDENRFSLLETDSGIITISKSFKRFFFWTSTLPKRVFGKKKRDELYWKHKVPVRRVLRHHLIVDLCNRILTLRDPLFVESMKAHLALKEWEYAVMKKGEKATPPEISSNSRKAISTQKRKVKKALKEIAESCWEDMLEALAKVDTIELSSRSYQPDSVNYGLEKANKKWSVIEKNWINNLDVFLEDWRSDLAIQMLMLQAEADMELFCENQDENMDDYLGEELDAIQSFISTSLDEIDKSKDDLGSVIKKQLYHAQKTLDKQVIPSLIEKLGNKNLVSGIDRLSVGTFKEMEKLTVERKVPKVSTEYLTPLADDDITTMSPYELIAFEIAPELKDTLDGIKAKLSEELHENLLIAQDLDHIIAFGLNTALDELEDEVEAQEVATIATTSLKRAQSRATDVKDSLQKAMDLVNESVAEAIHTYQASLNELTENENVREIRLRILRAKTLQQTEEYREQVKGTAKTWFSKGLAWTKDKWQYVTNLKNRLTKKLITEDKGMDVEVANFLIDSEKVITALPVIYRNLYQIQPVKDLELFVGREKELKNLSLAYENWCNNKKGAAVIVGEKWSGLTSFINYCQSNNLFNHPCNRFKPLTSLDGEAQVFEFLNSIVTEAPSKKMDWDAMAVQLKSENRRVIIIEDIQCLYLRRVGGFDTLNGLASLVHQTSGHIFWIMTSTSHAWKYLIKTIGMNEAFRFQINFTNPSADQVADIIKKRIRISGYKMIFRKSEEDESNKKFLKLDEESQQRYLRDRFFDQMVNFAAGNISMALMFWLLSTEKVNEDQVEISAFAKPDFSFLHNYSQTWIFALHQLVLHDGLNLEQFALVSRTNKREATVLLLALQEDGILLDKDGFYVINPLIYRSVINLLVSKNLILK